MRNKRITVAFSFYIFILGLIITKPAYAYLDPGAGSVILQGFIAAIATVVIVARLYWHKILAFLGVHKKISTSKKDQKKV